MARHWQYVCVDAVATLPLLRARRFSETIRVELRAFLSIRSDDSSRLVDEAAHRRGRGVIAPPAPLGPGWRVTGAGVMATHWQDACVDAVAKLPPLRARRFSATVRVELAAFPHSVTTAPRHDGAPPATSR